MLWFGLSAVGGIPYLTPHHPTPPPGARTALSTQPGRSQALYGAIDPTNVDLDCNPGMRRDAFDPRGQRLRLLSYSLAPGFSHRLGMFLSSTVLSTKRISCLREVGCPEGLHILRDYCKFQSQGQVNLTLYLNVYVYCHIHTYLP